jgi:hypothetical protein
MSFPLSNLDRVLGQLKCRDDFYDKVEASTFIEWNIPEAEILVDCRHTDADGNASESWGLARGSLQEVKMRLKCDAAVARLNFDFASQQP